MADRRWGYHVTAAAAVVGIGLDISIPAAAVPHAVPVDAPDGLLARC